MGMHLPKNQTVKLNLTEILDVEVTVNGDEELEEYNFELILMDWTQKKMVIFINFTDPLVISNGMFPDQLVCMLKNSNMFIDKV